MALGLLFSLASTGLSMFGEASQGKAAKQAAAYNAELDRQRARNAENEFLESSTRARLNNRSDRAELINRQATSGITQAGTPATVLARAAGAQELAIADAARAANQTASDLRSRAAMTIYNGQQQASAAKLSMLGIGLQGAARFYETRDNLKYQGVKTI